MKHSSQWNLTRESVLGSGLAAETPGLGLAARLRHQLGGSDICWATRLHWARSIVPLPGGVDTVSDPPVVYPKVSADAAAQLSRQELTERQNGALVGPTPEKLQPRPARGCTNPAPALSMGESTELMVKTWGITRAEQDQLALESHQKAAAAYASGFYKDLVTSISASPRTIIFAADSSLEKLAKLKPVFDSSGAGTLTAGNSTPMTDGASAVLLATEAWARERNLPVLAYLSYGKVAAVDYIEEGRPAHGACLCGAPNADDAGIKLQDFDFYEIHEAFAGQVLCTLKAWADPAFCRDRLRLPGAWAPSTEVGST